MLHNVDMNKHLGNAPRRMSDRSGKTAMDYATMEKKSLIAAIIEANPYIVHIHDMCELGLLLRILVLCNLFD